MEMRCSIFTFMASTLSRGSMSSQCLPVPYLTPTRAQVTNNVNEICECCGQPALFHLLAVQKKKKMGGRTIAAVMHQSSTPKLLTTQSRT